MIRTLSRFSAKSADHFLTFSCILKKDSNYYVVLHHNECGYITMPSTSLRDVPLKDLNVVTRKTIPKLFQDNVHNGLSIPLLNYNVVDTSNTNLFIYRGIEHCCAGYFDLDHQRHCDAITNTYYHNHVNSQRSSRNTILIKKTLEKFDYILKNSENINNEYYILKSPYRSDWVQQMYFLKLFTDNDMNLDTIDIDLNTLQLVRSHKTTTQNFQISYQCMNLLNANLNWAYQYLSKITTRSFIVQSINT